MELSCSNTEKLYIFSQKNAFLISQKTETPKRNLLIFQEAETLKNFLHFRKKLPELEK